jgi:type IV pilus assembly protein PilW
MNVPLLDRKFCRPYSQRGFTLIELSIAVLIGLFLVGGLLTLLGAMKRTSGIQNGMGQLQDSERLAMTLITDVVQSAGYWPDPKGVDVSLAFPVFAPNFAAVSSANLPQTIFGTGSGTAAAPGDILTVRYQASGSGPGSDGVINCLGGTNQSVNPVTFVNEFSIVVDATGISSLQCKLTVIDSAGNQTITTTPLVSNVQNLQVYYGIKADGTNTNTSVDTYEDANQVADWTQIMTVKLSLTFLNPISAQPGQPPTIKFMRVVDIMNRTGI